MNISKTIAFSGYRPEKMPAGGDETSDTIQHLKKMLAAEIVCAITAGFDTFLVGMAQGFDTYAALEVLHLKSTIPHIKLICALPFERSHDTDETYRMILARADETIVLSEEN